jgi:hypothetical protein
MSFTKGGELMSVPRYTTPVFTLTFKDETGGESRFFHTITPGGA